MIDDPMGPGDPLREGDHGIYTVTRHEPKAVQAGPPIISLRKEKEKRGIKTRFTLVRFADLKPDDEPEYLVPGLIPAEGFGVVWGPPKHGKSFWIFDLLMHVALGWLYRDREVQLRLVVYCAFEGAKGFKKRAAAFRNRYSNADDAEFYQVLPNQGSSPAHRRYSRAGGRQKRGRRVPRYAQPVPSWLGEQRR